MILKAPPFKPLPPSTDAADVPENIDHWIKTKQYDKLEHYTRLCSKNDYRGYRGRRFITAADLKEIIITEQVVLGVTLICEWVREYTVAGTRGFDPLCFREWYTSIYITMGTEKFTYCTDADLKRKVRAYKNAQLSQ